MSLPASGRQTITANRLIAALAPAERHVLQPHLQRETLHQHQVLETAGEAVERVYFIEQGCAALFSRTGDRRTLAPGLIGREGVTGLSVLLQADHAAHDVVMHGPGTGLGIDSVLLGAAIETTPSLRRVLARYVHALMLQISATALAFGEATLEERLARWLLMVHDRVAGNDILTVHESLARTLGVRRPGVTMALHKLESQRLIRVLRGRIIITDRNGLEAKLGRLYGAPEAEYRNLIG